MTRYYARGGHIEKLTEHCHDPRTGEVSRTGQLIGVIHDEHELKRIVGFLNTAERKNEMRRSKRN